MMNPGEFDPQALLLQIFKVGFIAGGFLYIIFAFIIIKQIKVMKNTLITSFSPAIQLLGIAHFIYSIIIVIVYFAIL